MDSSPFCREGLISLASLKLFYSRLTNTAIKRHFTVHISTVSHIYQTNLIQNCVTRDVLNCVPIHVWAIQEQRIFDEFINLLPSPSPFVCLYQSKRGTLWTSCISSNVKTDILLKTAFSILSTRPTDQQQKNNCRLPTYVNHTVKAWLDIKYCFKGNMLRIEQ